MNAPNNAQVRRGFIRHIGPDGTEGALIPNIFGYPAQTTSNQNSAPLAPTAELIESEKQELCDQIVVTAESYKDSKQPLTVTFNVEAKTDNTITLSVSRETDTNYNESTTPYAPSSGELLELARIAASAFPGVHAKSSWISTNPAEKDLTGDVQEEYWKGPTYIEVRTIPDQGPEPGA